MPPVKRRGVQKPKDAAKTIKRLFSYMTHFKVLWVFVVLCVILDAGANIAGFEKVATAMIAQGAV